MKKLYACIFVFFSAGAFAQPHGNEWISFSSGSQYSLQQYFKISTWKDGIYKITYSDLQAAGVPVVSWFDPSRYKIYYRGSEQFIYVNQGAGNPSSFDAGDYVEFYGKRNDGSFDTQLYDSAASQPNPWFSLFNDTNAYFLTYDISANPAARRMVIETDVNVGSYPQVPYFIRDEIVQYTDLYLYGNDIGSALTDNSYTSGEGWTSNRADIGVFPVNVPAPNFYTGGPPASVTTRVMGANGNLKIIDVSVEGTVYANLNFYGYEVHSLSFNLNAPVTDGTVNVAFSQAVSNPSYYSVPFVKLSYPHTMSFSGEALKSHLMHLAGNLISNKGTFDISGYSLTGGDAPRLYVFAGDTVKKIPVLQNGSLFQCVVPGYGSTISSLLTSDNQLLTGSGTNFKIAPVSSDPNRYAKFINYLFANSNSNYLIITNSLLWNPAKNYETYRTTPAGGSYNVLTADIDELYNQFGSGIIKHPLSIRNFCDFALDNFAVDPEYLFIIGKSIRAEESRFDLNNYNLNYVPTYGNPPSDLMFTAALNSPRFYPEIATGRLAARTEQDVYDYLDKITVMESLQTELWMKRVLHFCGGLSQTENDRLCSYLANYETIIEDTLYGGNVITFSKTSSTPIQINQSQYLQSLIDSGVSMMTFFAHAAGSSFDISTDDPSNWKNTGKYPLIIANSCYIGDIHTPVRQASENYVLQDEKGTIGFIAAPAQGFEYYLDFYTNMLYRQIGIYNYGGSIGKCMQATIDSIIVVDNLVKSTCMSMTLHGDPAIVMYAHEKPDLEITTASISFEPALVTSEIDSFEIKIGVTNNGKAVAVPFTVEVVRNFPNGSLPSVKLTSMNYVAYRDTLSLWFPTDRVNGPGLNSFDVYVDRYNVLDELNELNNLATAQLLIQSTDIAPVYPYEFAIVPNATCTLKATTANPFAPVRNYVFQIATTDTFDASMLANTTITQSGGVLSWALPFQLAPNQVYYWRVGVDSVLINDSLYQWKESSFIHIPSKTGWSQADFYQFKKDDFLNVDYNRPSTAFDFVTTKSQLLCKNFSLFHHPDPVAEYYIDNSLWESGGCVLPALHVAVIDSVSLLPWKTDQFYFGNHNTYSNGTGTCRNRPEAYFIFGMSIQSEADSFAALLNTKIPNGNYVLIYSLAVADFDSLPSNVITAMNNIGATDFVTAPDSFPYCFFMKAGYPSTIVTEFGDTTEILTGEMGGNWDRGFINSVTIGPSTQWESFHWEVSPHPLDQAGANDSIMLTVMGIRINGQQDTVISGIAPSVTDIFNLNDSADAAIYPYLKLSAYVEDEGQKNPPQIDKWQIYYQEIPEAALNPSKHFVPPATPVQEGASVSVEIALENISNVPMDSMLFDYYFYDANHVKHPLPTATYRPLSISPDTIIAKISFSTLGYPGLNSLWIEANPGNDQLEQYHFNNLAEIKFQADKDITNPIMDVTFDGIHILNGDIVSARPNILIQLHDENKFLALNDTNDFRVWITHPSGQKVKLQFDPFVCVSSDSLKMKWCPAQLPKNSFKIEYAPGQLADGTYELEVEASDRSDNLSGTHNYRITFEVINKSTITEIINYPNPFSTSTRFVFTITGSEIPDEFTIQIMTVTGKIVREIMRHELGSIHIGRNITEYAWDGKDEYGDQLANGIYLYRVKKSIRGAAIEKREVEELNTFFTKGWGKMYLMR